MIYIVDRLEIVKAEVKSLSVIEEYCSIALHFFGVFSPLIEMAIIDPGPCTTSPCFLLLKSLYILKPFINRNLVMYSPHCCLSLSNWLFSYF
jgi:hypothetical protein